MHNWTREELRIDREFEIDCDKGETVLVYVETWFDVDEKFGTHTKDLPDTWVNLYARYNPTARTLEMEYEVNAPDKVETVEYVPNEEDKQLVMALIEEACQKYEHCSVSELLEKDRKEGSVDGTEKA